MKHLLQPNSTQLTEWLAEREFPAYRAAQVRKWLFQRRAESFDDMTDLPKDLRQRLAADFAIWTTAIVDRRQAGDGTEKLLLALADGGRIECVLLRDGVRRSICISSQVGCGMGCVFCASGLDGVDRNLTAGEIVEQMLRLERLLPQDERLSHIVVMGMGEPLANFDAVIAALGEAVDPQMLGISHRRITISTVGLPKMMDRLVREECRYNLAVSLHAPNDALRTRIVPTAGKTPLRDILSAADRYFEASGRRLTFEYVLLADINDGAEHARELVHLLRGRDALLNVIPYNPVAGLPYQTPTLAVQRRFRRILEEGGVNIQFRERKGDEIDAACGQLRRISPLVPLASQASSASSPRQG